MCGFIVTNKKIDINTNLKILDHRGPHSNSFFQNKNVTIIFNRLSIIDLKKRSNQPMLYKNLVISFNGEIFNYEEIKKKLIKKGIKFITTSDTEVLLKLFYIYGSKCLGMIEGMFAFVIYNKNDNSIFAARDPFGIKPLFYSIENKKIFISSEKHVFFKNMINKELNLNSIHNYLKNGVYQESSNTFFKNIHSLEPGHYLKISNDNFYYKKWFNIELKENKIEYEEAKFELKKILTKSISSCLIGDRKLAIACSGGVDSSAIAEISNNIGNPNFKYLLHYTCNDSNDETQFAKNLNMGLKLNFLKSNFDKEDFFLFLKKSFMSLNEPVGGLNNLNALKGYSLLKKKKIHVLLDGNGSDEIFGGYKHYINNYYNKKNYTSFPIQGHEYQFNDFLFNKTFLNNVKINEYKKKLTTKELMLNDLMGKKVRSQLLQGDHLSMKYSVETRYPFLNIELVKFAINLPEKFLFNNNRGKFILREILNNNMRKIKKRILQTPQNEWMDQFIKKKLLYELKNNPNVNYEQIFNKKKVINFLETTKCKTNSVIEWRILMICYFLKFLPKF